MIYPIGFKIDFMGDSDSVIPLIEKLGFKPVGEIKVEGVQMWIHPAHENIYLCRRFVYNFQEGYTEEHYWDVSFHEEAGRYVDMSEVSKGTLTLMLTLISNLFNYKVSIKEGK